MWVTHLRAPPGTPWSTAAISEQLAPELRWSSPSSLQGEQANAGPTGNPGDECLVCTVVTPEEARAKQIEAWETLKVAIGGYFDARLVADRLQHDAECADPLCDEKEERAKWGPQSLSTFVVIAEYTTMMGDGTTGTRTTQASHGSPMAVLGLITEASITWAS